MKTQLKNVSTAQVLKKVGFEHSVHTLDNPLILHELFIISSFFPLFFLFLGIEPLSDFQSSLTEPKLV